jgi:hypothetical protein
MQKSLLLLAALLVAQTVDGKAEEACARSLHACTNACPAKNATNDCAGACRAASDSCETSAAAALAKARANDMFESPRQAPRLPALRKTRAPLG